MSKPSRGEFRTGIAIVLLVALATACAIVVSPAVAQSQKATNKVPVVTGNPRVDKLLSEMTLEEKISMIHGAWENPATNQGQAGYLAGVPRLGIPSLRLSDGPPGVLTRLPSHAETATMGVAATFSKEDAEQNGVVIAREARSLGIDVVLEPFINIDRDITFSRGYNTFGEDPVLTGEIGAAEVRGIQSQGIMSQAKHYIAYDTAGNDVYVDQQALHEIYAAPFKDVVDAGVSSIMCSYNFVNGIRACGNPDTLNGILKKEFGFKGFVTSDWGATHAATFINNGLDMEMPGSLDESGSAMASMMFSFFNYKKVSSTPPAAPDMSAIAGALGMGGGIPEEPPQPGFGGGPGGDNDPRTNLWDALHSGAVKEEAITQAAGRVLYEYDKFGFLEHKPQHEILPHQIEANAKVIQKTGEDAAVLLKNEGHILPLKAADLASLAMIGPGAGQVVSIGTSGERSVGMPERQIGPFEAMKKTLGSSESANIRFAAEDDMTGTPIPEAILSHDGQPGLLRTSESGATQTDASLNFTKANGNPLAANAKASWKGTLTVPSDGDYWIYLQLLGASGSLSIDGKKIAQAGGGPGGMHGDTIQANQHNLLPTTDGLDNIRRAVSLTAGAHSIAISVSGDTSNAPEQIRLNWVTPADRKANHDAAIEAAKNSTTAVVFAWSRGNPDFALPGDQDKLINEIAAVNPNTIVVLNVSQPIAMPWLDRVKGVLQMWWPGDEGGWATASVLLGKTSPAGRLPFTWAKQLPDYPANDPAHLERSAKGVDGKTTFSEGIFEGYRWFDQQKIEPLYPFGYGLSYTSFDYSDLKVTSAADGGLNVSFKLKNSGKVASDEVPQVYLGAPQNAPQDAAFAEKALAGFTRVYLEAGREQTVLIHLPLRRLQYWSTAANKWQTARGPRSVLVGRSSRDLPLKAMTSVK
jgi:beta-glucosidase